MGLKEFGDKFSLISSLYLYINKDNYYSGLGLCGFCEINRISVSQHINKFIYKDKVYRHTRHVGNIIHKNDNL